MIVYLKNRDPNIMKDIEDEHIDWYEKAFGPKQNIMTLDINFVP